jgi:hypothetical protein
MICLSLLPARAFELSANCRQGVLQKTRLRDERGGLFFIHDSPNPPLHALLGPGPVLRRRALPQAAGLTPTALPRDGIGFFRFPSLWLDFVDD